MEALDLYQIFKPVKSELQNIPTDTYYALDLIGLDQRSKSPINKFDLPPKKIYKSNFSALDIATDKFKPILVKNEKISSPTQKVRPPSITPSEDMELCKLCDDTTTHVIGNDYSSNYQIDTNYYDDIDEDLKLFNKLKNNQKGTLKYLINAYNMTNSDKLIEFWNDTDLNKKTIIFINTLIKNKWLDYKYFEYRYDGINAFQFIDFINHYKKKNYSFENCINKYLSCKKATFCKNVMYSGGCDYPGCIFYHPECHLNNNCTIIGCNLRHDDERELKSNKNTPLCKYNEKCKRVNCKFRHDFVCKFGINCFYNKKNLCKGTHIK